MERRGRGKWRGGKGRAPKLLLNKGPLEPCYATEESSKMGMKISAEKTGVQVVAKHRKDVNIT